MALAYHILAHKNRHQLERLIRAILTPRDLLVLHLDQRAPSDLHQFGRRLAMEHPNVVLQKPRKVVWFGWQGLHLQLEGAALALAKSTHWSHFVNLSGQDFPVSPIAKTAEELAKAPDTSLVSWFDPTAVPLWSNARARIEHYHLASPLLLRVLAIPLLGRKLKQAFGWTNLPLPTIPGIRRRYPRPWPFLGGSNWCSLSRSACEWLTTDSAARAFARWVRHAGNPDELYFQSTLCSAQFPGHVENRSGRFVEFAPGESHPKVFTAADAPKLLSCGAHFARKFDENVDATILDLLERHIGA